MPNVFLKINRYSLGVCVTFFARAKKVTKKTQPILMRSFSSPWHFLGQNRRGQTELHRTLYVEYNPRRYEFLMLNADADRGNQNKLRKGFVGGFKRRSIGSVPAPHFSPLQKGLTNGKL
jgi:hypothetical protein